MNLRVRAGDEHHQGVGNCEIEVGTPPQYCSWITFSTRYVGAIDHVEALTPGRYYVSASSFFTLLICLSRYLRVLRQREVCISPVNDATVCNYNLEIQGGILETPKYDIHAIFYYPRLTITIFPKLRLLQKIKIFLSET